MTGREIDVAILGGGLAGGLTALALAARRPDARILLVEAGPRLGGNHVWSYFASDIPASAAWLVKPLAAAKWRGYGVRFPAFRRQLASSYRSITSDRLDAALREALPAEAILTDARVTAVKAHGFTLADGREFRAGAVIDARGAASFPGLVGGWQKFVGQMLRLEQPHGLTHPVVMDANLRHHEGFRFVYVLPFGPDRVFVEDTYYAASPVIDRDVLVGRIADYAAAQQWTIAEVLGEEQGVLPVVAGGEPGGRGADWRGGRVVSPLDRLFAADGGADGGDDCRPAGSCRGGHRGGLCGTGAAALARRGLLSPVDADAFWREHPPGAIQGF